MSSAAIVLNKSQSVPIEVRKSEFARDALAGLRTDPKWLPCKYFYDEEGSRIFDRICELPEYYPTRTEVRLLRENAGEMADCIGEDVELIEFGAGSLQKVGYLLDALRNPRAYVPLDISGEYLRNMARELKHRYESVAIRPVVADFTKPILLSSSGGARRVGFFPGSTIGNLDSADAAVFLRRTAQLLKGGGLLIGVDLVKDPAILHAAYNDAAGVTDAFNKNVLHRANKELFADFDLDAFAHYAFYNPHFQRVEMHLMSLEDQRVSIAGADVEFSRGETIHTENSHKYTLSGFRALAQEAGFAPRAVWTDPDRLFSLHWLEIPA